MREATREIFQESSPLASEPLGARWLPRILVDLDLRAFTGRLELETGDGRIAFAIDRGCPTHRLGETPGESVLGRLLEAGAIRPSDVARARALSARSQASPLAALVGLRRIAPQHLLGVLRDHFWDEMAPLFAHPPGRARLTAAASANPALAVLRCDPWPRIHAGLVGFGSSERMLTDLARHAHRFTTTTLALRAARPRLGDQAPKALLEGLDGSRPFAEAIASAAAAPPVLGALWLLEAAGLLDHRLEVAFDRVREAQRPRRLKIAFRGAPEPGLPPSRSLPATPPPSEPARQSALRDEILSRLACQADLDHYAVLGIPPQASAHDVKRAYRQLAKRTHPDAIRRHDLEGISEESARVFSRIAEAFEVLGDATKRSEYDRSLGADCSAGDAARVAQAEIHFRKAEILMRKGDFLGAERFLRPALALVPGEAVYSSALGWSLFRADPTQSDRAIEALTRAIEAEPENPLHRQRWARVTSASKTRSR
jgi:tetratricopeptide (TPR) repeat protein